MTTTNIEAGNARALAFKMGEKASEEFNQLIQGLIEKGEEVKRGPAATLIQLMAEYGDEFENFAVPGTEEGKTNHVPETFFIDLPKEEGGTKKTKMNWFTEFFAGTKDGKEFTYTLDQLALASKPETIGQVDEAFKKAFPGYNDPAARKVKTKQTRNRMSVGRGYIRKACALYQVLNRLETEYSDRVKWAFDLKNPQEDVTLENLKSTPQVVLIEDARNPKAWTGLAASQVLALDIDEAAKADGGLTYDRLLATLGRGANKDKTKKGQVPRITAPEAFLGYAYEVAAYVSPLSDEGSTHRAGILELARKGKNKDEYVTAIGDLAAFVQPLFAEIEDEYNELKRAQAKKELAERKAKAENDGQTSQRKVAVPA